MVVVWHDQSIMAKKCQDTAPAVRAVIVLNRAVVAYDRSSLKEIPMFYMSESSLSTSR